MSSTSCELPLSPRSYLYPHGIINPNYPGFQHLAHTLSEEYSTHASDCNLSDCGIMYQNSQIQPFDTINANDISSSDDNGNVHVNENNPASPISDSIISSYKEFNSYDHQTHVEQCNLQTYLNHYQNKSDIKFYDEEVEQMNVISVTPPDILFFKGYDTDIDNTGHSKPDLIQNVRDISCDKNVMTTPVTDLNDERNSLPPTNIVGDFEKEIEKEIVEIVSGYKDIFGDRTNIQQVPHTTTPVKEESLHESPPPPPVNNYHHPITAFHKIHDAKLSNGREAITPNFEMKPIKLPSIVKRAEVKQTENYDKFQFNNNFFNTTTAATTTRYNCSVNSMMNNNNSNEQQQKEIKHHYNCNFFNTISKNVNRHKTTSIFNKDKEWNTNCKTIIKKKGKKIR